MQLMVGQVYNVPRTSVLPTATANKVLRNTYALLGLLFVFGAGAAWVACRVWDVGVRKGGYDDGGSGEASGLDPAQRTTSGVFLRPRSDAFPLR